MEEKDRKTKVGIIMNSLECETHLYKLINDLYEDRGMDVYLLINKFKYDKKSHTYILNLISYCGMKKLFDYSFFTIMVYFEKIIFGTQNQKFRYLDEDIFVKKLFLSPMFSKGNEAERKIYVSYNEEDIKNIQELDLDIILRGNVSGVYHGKILTSSKKGIISFHHEDGRRNPGVPLGFWEIYCKKPSTEFSIKILSEKLDDEDVLFHGEAKTKPIYTLNQECLYEISYSYMKYILINFAKTGSLPGRLSKKSFSPQQLTIPKLVISLSYLAYLCSGFFFNIIIKKIIKNHHQRWSVAFTRTNWTTANLSKATIIKNPKGRFFADPFVKTVDDQTVVFVEDYHYSTKQGTISAIKIQNDGTYEIVPDIIKEQFHLSFPYIFEYQNQLYMVPESSLSNSIRLYKCTQFPDKWEYQHDIMQNVNAVDSMIFKHNDQWWLMSNINLSNKSNNLELFAFMSDSPLSRQWQPHRRNPICFSNEFGRNGGLLRDNKNNNFRVRQKNGFIHYGMAFTIAKINILDLENYYEDFHCEIQPNFFPNLSGTHHMHCDEEITVFDFSKDENFE